MPPSPSIEYQIIKASVQAARSGASSGNLMKKRHLLLKLRFGLDDDRAADPPGDRRPA